MQQIGTIGSIILLVILLLNGSGCARKGKNERPTIPLSYSFEGIKRIDRGGELGNDLSSYQQESYTLTSGNRLLMRFEALSEHQANINQSKPIRVEIAVTTDRTLALSRLQLCPITKQWMMLATWTLAHPFGGDGTWSKPGGDYDSSACFTGTPVDERLIDFDVSRWYKNYPIGRKGVNYGLILIASDEVTLDGDLSGSFSPRILFEEYQTVSTPPFSLDLE